MKFKEGDLVKCINDQPLSGNKIGPNLVIGEEYPVNNVILDSQGNQHLNVGLLSELEFVRSFETQEELKDGNIIHWCHPSRFQLVIKETPKKEDIF